VKRFLLVSILFVLANSCYAQSSTIDSIGIDSTANETYEELETSDFAGANDTINVDEKRFDKTAVDNLKNDPDYQYKQPPTVVESLWDRFKRWLGELFSALFRGATTTDVGQIIMYIIGIGILVVVIMMLLKVDAFKVFYSGADSGKSSNPLFHENIHEMDFERLLQDSVKKEDYRQSIRLVLLYALKLSADKNLIKWEVGKTNHDYVNELSNADLKTGLNELSFYFDYTWYGNFQVNRQTFSKVESTFSNWRNKISKN
jgi:hypothetical protein